MTRLIFIPPGATHIDGEKLRRALANGWTADKLAAAWGVPRSTVYRWLKAYGLTKGR